MKLPAHSKLTRPADGAGARPAHRVGRAISDSDDAENPGSTAGPASPRCPHGRSGVALVVTLVLLAIITTLAIAFVALTHRETASTAAAASTTDAELAASAALDRAKAEILANYIFGGGTNIAGPGLMVSVAVDQNRLVPEGAFVDPNPPVFVNTNAPGANGPLDDRHFLDGNQNHYFDETGFVPITSDVKDASGRYGRAFPESLGWDATNFVLGDPRWIGILANPRRWHTNNNQYVSRYAWMVVPASQTLDLNAIHNNALDNVDMSGGFNGYYRNQGVGSWELNLAGFLTDLNTNYWPAAEYRFAPLNLPATPAGVAAGISFNDAREILTYRYTTNYPAPPFPHRSLGTGLELFPSTKAADVGLPATTPVDQLETDFVDYYSRLRLDRTQNVDVAAQSWPGARGLRNFRSIHDLLNPTILPDPNGFRTRLASASVAGNSYDRYTYYRLLSQLGTPPAERDDRINLNYVNVPSWVTPSYRLDASDMIPWNTTTAAFKSQMGREGPELFFLSAVRQMLLTEAVSFDTNFLTLIPNPSGTPFAADHPLDIPVYTNGSRFITRPDKTIISGPLYSGRIHQILQLAANLYDAVHGTAPAPGLLDFPTVFRPRFEKRPEGIFLIDYEVLSSKDRALPANYGGVLLAGQNPKWIDLDLEGRSQATANGSLGNALIYNIPMIVGARRGFPNFNEFASKTVVKADRRLTVRKPVGVMDPDLTQSRVDQELSIEVISQFDTEAWYSYFTTNYPQPVSLFYSNNAVVEVRVDNGFVNLSPGVKGTNTAPSIGYTTLPANTYFPPPNTSLSFSNRVFLRVTNSVVDVGGTTNSFAITIRNQLKFFLVDSANNRLIDAVGLSLTNEFFDVARDLSSPIQPGEPLAIERLWSRDRGNLRNQGVMYQLQISKGDSSINATHWRNYAQDVPSMDAAIRNFTNQLSTPESTIIPVPFVAVRTMTQENSWRVNDPLVHYTEEDLWRGVTTNNSLKRLALSQAALRLDQKNKEYEPWDPNSSPDLRVKDPGIKRSDLWNFPTNRFPSAGWIGRVHRGTPWQTIYLKSDTMDDQALASNFERPIGGTPFSPLTGARRRLKGTVQALNPARDARLLDIFSTTVHTNATRGRLSINQTNLAAWSAVLSGVNLQYSKLEDPDGLGRWVPTNNLVEPSAIDSRLNQVVTGINDRRRTIGRSFRRLSDLIRVPQLSVQSPYLPSDYDPSTPSADADYERIPQQIMSLVKVGVDEARYVVYAWGQSLKPAEFGVEARANGVFPRGASVETSGDRRGLVHNYQITGEMATRAVIRVGFERRSTNPDNPLYYEFDYTRPHAVVESFNIVPPD